MFPEKSPVAKSSAKMKRIEEGMEDDVFEEPAPDHHSKNTSAEEQWVAEAHFWTDSAVNSKPNMKTVKTEEAQLVSQPI